MENYKSELRSEKMRSIIGKVPPILWRLGIAVLTGVVVLVLALLYNIPYPERMFADAHVFYTNNDCLAETKY